MPTLKQKIDDDLDLILLDLKEVKEEFADPDGDVWLAVGDLTDVIDRLARVRQTLISVSRTALRQVVEGEMPK